MAHIHDLIDFTVMAFIVHDRKVLLVFHKKLQKWLPIGGHIELDEDPEHALFREIMEESGLDVKILATKPDSLDEGRRFLFAPSYLDIHKITDQHSHIGMVYFAKADSDQVVLAEREHDAIRWFSQEDMENLEFNLQEDVKFYMREALKKV